MKVFVVDPQAVFRRGLVSCMASMEDVGSVADAGSVPEAAANPALDEADVVLVDRDVPGGIEFIRSLRDSGPTVVVCSSGCDEQGVLSSVQAGAVGYLSKDTLTPEALANGVRAAASGAGVMAPEALGSLLRGISRVSREMLEPRGLSLCRLTAREQQVLRLVAEGHATREVANRLCYSERTVKNVVHDAVTKLNARTRSQAVAEAVRAGLI